MPTFLDATHTHADPRFAHVAVRAAEIAVVEGPDAGVRMRVDGPTFTVGSGASAHLRLADGAISREHFRLEVRENGLFLQDPGSKNGTWLGGVRVERALLAADVTIKLGATVLTITLDREPSLLTVTEATRFGDAIGASTPMRHLFAYLEKAAETDVSLLLEGESGVGKEVLARAVHARSSRAAGPFVVVDCSAIAPHLVESELFGHEKGAFTGADRARLGLFVEANGGTIFLDEIGELPMDLQPKLLRALEAREVRPVGSNRTQRIDFRLVAATHRNLAERVKAGSFREDLFYRVAIGRVRVPPLREREGDVVLLAQSFLHALRSDAELPPDVVAMFRSYAWPGNVRELKNAVGRFALLGARERRELLPTAEADIGAASEKDELATMRFHDARQLVIERFERSYFEAVLARADGNVSKAADLAGVARSTYYRMLERAEGRVPPDDDE